MMRAALLLVTCLLVASSAPAQEEAVRTIPFDGTEVFCHILNYEKLAAVASLKELQQNPDQSVLILFGNPRKWFKDGLPIAVSQFLGAGGNLLVASDHEMRLPGISVAVTGKPAPKAHARHAYRGDPMCPLLSSGGAMQEGHPIFGLLRQGIATNCPSRLKIERAPNSPFILLAPYVDRILHQPTGVEEYFESGVAMAGSRKNAPPQGRALFIAGHGLFMNGMMLQSDNDNFAFAINVVRWLREGANGTARTRAMFIVDGEVITNFDTNLTPPPLVPMPTVKAIDRLLHGLEQERFFHRVLDRLIGENRNAILSVLFAGVTFLLLLYGAKKLMEGRSLLETTAPRMIGIVPSLVPAAPAAVQRPSALFRQANLANEARLMARAWLRQEFGLEPEQWSLETRPAFQVNGWFWGRRSAQRHADRVLQLAYAADLAPMTRREFARLLRALPKLSDARRRERLTLLAAGKTVR